MSANFPTDNDSQPAQHESQSTVGGVATAVRSTVFNNDPSSSVSNTPLRMRTNTAEIDDTIIHPGSVKINVQGAFIVDEKNSNAHGSPPSPNGGSQDTNDIRLPNHTAVVSHIAVDVGSIVLSIDESPLTCLFPY